MVKKRIIAIVMSVVTICSFAGCSDKEDTKTEKPKNEIVSQETAETDNNGLVGTWVVTKTEAYDGPYKSMVEPALNIDHYVGAEYTFTADGFCKNAAGTMTTTYSILNDHQILTKVVNGPRSENVSEYELNGDEFVLYCHYYSDNNSKVPLSRTAAIYFKRK